jgi:hypothetical protein
MFRIGAIATGGNVTPPGNLTFTKTALVGWMFGSWTQRYGIALAEGFWDVGVVIFWLRTFHGYESFISPCKNLPLEPVSAAQTPNICNIMPPFRPRSPELPFTFNFSNFLRAFSSRTCYMPRPPLPHWFALLHKTHNPFFQVVFHSFWERRSNSGGKVSAS